jgi:hypothetical protein
MTGAPPRQSIAERSPLLADIVAFTQANGRAPVADEVYQLARFREAGPINRLCAALSEAAEVFAIALKVQP